MIYDAHVHFDLKEENPYTHLKKNMKNSDIDSCMLILNSEEEIKVFQNLRNCIISDNIVRAVAVILDINNMNSYNFYEEAKNEKLNIAIKLHPRLTGIMQKDFENIYHVLKRMNPPNIIIDSFIYGPELKNHVGIELAIFLAERLQYSTITLTHAGGCDILKCMLLTRPLKNIVYDYSLTCCYLKTTSIRIDLINGLMFFSDRIMFGTDFPDFNFCESRQEMERLCAEARLTEKQKEDIFYNNAYKIYGGSLRNV